MTDSKRRSRRNALIALVSVPAIIGLVVPGLGLVNFGKPAEQVTPTTTTAPPALTIKPLSVRPVVNGFVTTPEQCPAPPPAAPDKPIRICDLARTAVYELEPEGLRLQLTNVDSFRNPLTGVELVQMSMTPESAQQFAEFTGARVGQQVAFVRTGAVVWAPKISAPIDGQVIQLSGEDLTAEEATKIAKALKDGT